MLTPEMVIPVSKGVVSAVVAHAREADPEEVCGLVVGGEYVRCRNIAVDRRNEFSVHPEDWARAEAGGDVEFVLHSHTDGTYWPSLEDMVGQAQSGVPWGLVAHVEGRWRGPVCWGDGLPVAPLLHRMFIHGVWDCFALVRDWYRTERGVTMPDLPRSFRWWTRGEAVLSRFKDFGFEEVGRGNQRPAGWGRVGDAVLMRVVGGDRPVDYEPNHCAVVTSAGGLILHHLTGRLSREEPLGPWEPLVTHWLRYSG